MLIRIKMRFTKTVEYNAFQFNPELPEQNNSNSFVDYKAVVQENLPEIELKTVDRFVNYLGQDVLSVVHYCNPKCNVYPEEFQNRFGFELKSGDWLVENQADEHGYSVMSDADFNHFQN